MVILAHIGGFWSCCNKEDRALGQKQCLVPVAQGSTKSARFRRLLSFNWRPITYAFSVGISGWCFLAVCRFRKQPVGCGRVMDRETCLWPLGLEVLEKVLHSPELVFGSWWCWTRVSGVCRTGSCRAMQHLWADQFSLAPVQRFLRFLQLLCVWRGGPQLWWHLPHLPCCGQVLPAASRCKVFNWVHLLRICWWSDMLVLVVWCQAGLYHVAQAACVGSVAPTACHTGPSR